MQNINKLWFINICTIALVVLSFNISFSQESSNAVEQIVIYKGDKAGTGPGMAAFKLTVGEEIIVTAKGIDIEGKEVPIWPTWKADKELSIKVVEGRSKTAVIKALKEGAPVFFEAIYIRDDGKKVTGVVGGEVKPKK